MAKQLILLVMLSFFSTFVLVGCSRPDANKSTLKFKIPVQSKIQAMNLFPEQTQGQKECFAISVRGSRISDRSNECGITVGVTSLSAEPGQTISVDVPTGTARTVDVYLYTTFATASCPSLDRIIAQKSYEHFYKVGTVSGLEVSGETHVTVSVDQPSASNSIGVSSAEISSCQYTERGYLLSNGDITDFNSVPISGFSPVVDSAAAFNWNALSSGNLVLKSSVGNLRNSGMPFKIPPYVRSVMTVPGLNGNTLYGVRDDGVVLKMTNFSPSVLPTIAELNPASCPLSSCLIPVWMKSASIAPDLTIKGLDHGGNLYDINGSQAQLVSSGIPEYIEQIIY